MHSPDRNTLLRNIESSTHIQECLRVEFGRRPEKIQAIKELRAISGAGLKESKEAVDAWVNGDRPTSDLPQMDATTAGWLIRSLLERTSFGETDRQALQVAADVLVAGPQVDVMTLGPFPMADMPQELRDALGDLPI